MNNSRFQIIVPARYQSTRLPGKPLLEINGKPMVQHVYEQCQQSNAENVVVATDHRKIMDAVLAFGGKAVLTSNDHASGSDRIAEAVDLLGLDDNDLIVNVQGDEPDMPPELIDQVANALAQDPDAAMATARAPLDDPAQLEDPSVVKVVCDRAGYAIYFSRATIPWVRSDDSSGLASHAIDVVRRHLGIYAYSAGYIRQFSSRKQCELENLEKLEQLRSLWHGDKIRCVEAAQIPGPGIDTTADLARARRVII